MAQHRDGPPSEVSVSTDLEWLRQEPTRRQVIALLGGPILTPDAARALDAEWGTALPDERDRG